MLAPVLVIEMSAVDDTYRRGGGVLLGFGSEAVEATVAALLSTVPLARLGLTFAENIGRGERI